MSFTYRGDEGAVLGLVGIVAKRLKQFVADEEGRGVKADRESDFQAATTAESPLMQRRHLIPRGGVRCPRGHSLSHKSIAQP